MQLHGPSEPVDAIPVEPYGTSGNVALRLPACMWLVLTSPQDADRLIIAATQAKDLMLVTQPEGQCRPPHGPDRRCFDCATDDEMAAAIPPFPSGGAS